MKMFKIEIIINAYFDLKIIKYYCLMFDLLLNILNIQKNRKIACLIGYFKTYQ
jgi:hypothetical protein